MEESKGEGGGKGAWVLSDKQSKCSYSQARQSKALRNAEEVGDFWCQAPGRTMQLHCALPTAKFRACL